MKFLNNKVNLIPIILFAITFLAYFRNISPSVFGGDAGDFISAALTRGVPHPPGYPLFTILGIITLSLPFDATPAFKVGLVSSVISSITVVLFYFLITKLTKDRLISFISSLIFAFSYTYWLYSEIAEVFTLHIFFIVLITLLLVYCLKSKNPKLIIITSFVCGLSLTNNLAIILLFPSVAFMLVLIYRKALFEKKIIIYSSIAFLLSLLPYIYIPLAALKSPAVNWGNAVNIDNFFYLVLRKQYGWGVGIENTDYLSSLALESSVIYWLTFLGPLIPIISVIGLVFLFIKKERLFLFFNVFNLFLFGPFFIIYARTSIRSFAHYAVLERFYLSVFVILMFVFPLGLLAMKSTVPKLLKNPVLIKFVQLLIPTVFLFYSASTFYVNNFKTDLSDIYIGDNLGIDILEPLPRDTILFLASDSTAFNSLYIQHAYNFRKDVIIPGKHSGFERILKLNGFSDDQVKLYSITNMNTIDMQLLYTTIASNIGSIDIYSETPLEIIDDEYGKILAVPYGLIYKLMYEEEVNKLTKTEYVEKFKEMTKNYHLEDFNKHEYLINENLTYADIRRRYALSYMIAAKYLVDKFEDPESAVELINKAREIDPSYFNTGT